MKMKFRTGSFPRGRLPALFPKNGKERSNQMEKEMVFMAAQDILENAVVKDGNK